MRVVDSCPSLIRFACRRTGNPPQSSFPRHAALETNECSTESPSVERSRERRPSPIETGGASTTVFVSPSEARRPGEPCDLARLPHHCDRHNTMSVVRGNRFANRTGKARSEKRGAHNCRLFRLRAAGTTNAGFLTSERFRVDRGLRDGNAEEHGGFSLKGFVSTSRSVTSRCLAFNGPRGGGRLNTWWRGSQMFPVCDRRWTGGRFDPEERDDTAPGRCLPVVFAHLGVSRP